MAWTESAIREAAREWIWLPDGAPRVVTDEYTVVAYPEHFGQPTQVFGTTSTRSPLDLWGRVGESAQELGRSTASWWVDDDTIPHGLEPLLQERTGDAHEIVSVLALDLSCGLPAANLPDSVTATVVEDEAALRAWALVNHGAWDAPLPSEEEFARQVADLDQERSHGEVRVVGCLDGLPVSIGGCTIVAGVARLWGAATLRDRRRQGGYRVVLHERLRQARNSGASLALVKGRVSTSAPILRGVGFRVMGDERAYRVVFT